MRTPAVPDRPLHRERDSFFTRLACRQARRYTSGMGLHSRRRVSRVGRLATLLFGAVGCVSGAERARLLKDNDSLRRASERLERTVAQRDETVASLHKQIENLKGFAPGRPVDLFAPVSLEIAGLSGGADYDGKPGDDGITVYLRPRDADGDTVKVPGRMKVQLVDNTVIGSPRVLGVYAFDDPNETRKVWHAKFGTQHFSLKCPFRPDVELPKSRRVMVSAEFIDLLTGATLTASQEVGFSMPD
jgi:hypothetical protein